MEKKNKISSYKDLLIWQKSLEIVDLIYSITKKFPNDEKFGLINQMRRSAVSISSNIAEGWGREYSKSFINYLRISRASLFELETQVIISYRQNYIEESEYVRIENMLDHESRMIKNLIKSLNDRSLSQLQEGESEYFTLIDRTFSAEHRTQHTGQIQEDSKE